MSDLQITTRENTFYPQLSGRHSPYHRIKSTVNCNQILMSHSLFVKR